VAYSKNHESFAWVFRPVWFLSEVYLKLRQHSTPLDLPPQEGCFQVVHCGRNIFQSSEASFSNNFYFSFTDFYRAICCANRCSGAEMGAALLQQGHLVAFFCKVFYPWYSKASTYVQELHAIISVVKRRRQYLLGVFLIIQTDHKSLRELLTQVIQTPK
jgi:hypothetical protein